MIQRLLRPVAMQCLCVASLFYAMGVVMHGRNAVDQWKGAVSGNLTHERVLGLLDLPEIVGIPCGPTNPQSVDLYRTPSTKNSPIGSVRYLVPDREPHGYSCGVVQLVLRRPGGADEEVPTDESAEDIAALIVYQRAGSWFRVALQHGSGWMRREDPRNFLAYPDLLTRDQAYLRRAWDRRLWRTPAADAPARVPSKSRIVDGNGNTPVEVLGHRLSGNEVWMRVRLGTRDDEGNRVPGVKAMTGWLPAYRASGATSAWFYSRD